MGWMQNVAHWFRGQTASAAPPSAEPETSLKGWDQVVPGDARSGGFDVPAQVQSHIGQAVEALRSHEMDEADNEPWLTEAESRVTERVHTGDWIGLDGVWESKVNVERSDEGYHYEVHTSRYGGDGPDSGLSEAFATLDEAKSAGYEHMHRMLEPMEEEALAREEREIAAWERHESSRIRNTDIAREDEHEL